MPLHDRSVALVLAGAFTLQAATARSDAPALTGRIASADSAETVFSNPAGMTRLGDRAATVQAMLAQSFGEFEVDDDRTTARGGDPDGPAPVIIPFGFYAMELAEGWHAGISLTVPSGFGADYGDDWAGRYYSDYYSLVYVALTPALAYRINRHLSLGVALGVNYTSSESKVSFNNLTPGYADGRIEADVDGVGFNFTVSMLYEFDARNRFGMVYTSESDSDLEGDLKFRNLGPVLQTALAGSGQLDSDIEISNTLPQRVAAGYHHELQSGDYVTVDGFWMEFSKFGTTSIAIDGTDLRYDDDGTYNDIWGMSIGAGFPRGRYTWKIGVFHLSQPVDDDKRTLALALDRVWALGAGVSFAPRDTRRIDFNVNIIDTGAAEVDTGPSATRGRVVGKTENPYLLMLDASYHF